METKIQDSRRLTILIKKSTKITKNLLHGGFLVKLFSSKFEIEKT